MNIRKTFILFLNPGSELEYKKRHDEIWPEMIALLKSHDVHNYSISLEKDTNKLFCYAEIESEEKWADIANSEICKRWWDYMCDIMLCNSDNSPKSIELTEMFYMQ